MNLVTHLLPKMQVGNEHLEMGQTLGLRTQEVGDISRKKEEKKDAGRLVAGAKGLYAMTKMPEVIPINFWPGVLASVMPERLRCVNAYLPW